MLPISDDIKSLFTDGQSHSYDMRLDFGNTKYFTQADKTIFSSGIRAESAELTETLVSGTQFDFGKICPSMFKCDIFSSESLVGKFLKVTLIYEGNEIPYGRFYVTECKRESDNDYRNLVAYDYLYFFGLKDISAAWNYSHGYGGTAQQALNQIISYTGIEAETITLSNNFSINTVNQNSMLTYADILCYIGEINGGWFRMTREGVLRFVTLSTSMSMDTSEKIATYTMGSAEYGDFTAGAIDSLSYTGLVDGAQKTIVYAPSYSTQEHTYELNDSNDYLYDLTESELTSRLAAIYLLVMGHLYAPMKVKCDGRPYLEVGDRFRMQFTTVNRDDDGSIISTSTIILVSYVFDQTISGIGGLSHKISADADEQEVIGEKERQKRINALMRDIVRN